MAIFKLSSIFPQDILIMFSKKKIAKGFVWENTKKLKILKLSRDLRYLQKLALKQSLLTYLYGYVSMTDV